MQKLTQQQLEAHLWGAANILRGKTAGQDYKNYILSLMFFKRLCDQWHHEADVVGNIGGQAARMGEPLHHIGGSLETLEQDAELRLALHLPSSLL